MGADPGSRRGARAQVVLMRSGLPTDRTYRFFVGCHEARASWTQVQPDAARRSLRNVDWKKFYA